MERKTVTFSNFFRRDVDGMTEQERFVFSFVDVFVFHSVNTAKFTYNYCNSLQMMRTNFVAAHCTMLEILKSVIFLSCCQ